MLPSSLDYGQVGGLSAEVQQLLSAARPASLGAASRIPGITPAAILALLRHVKKRGTGAGAQRGSAALKRRSEEHTSELQSLMRISYAVFCLKKKKTQDNK